MDILDFDEVGRLAQQKYISVRQHKKFPLYIYNYTPRCQHDWLWTPETIACRGLIFDANNKLVARPFKKFFTLNQYESIDVVNLYGITQEELRAKLNGPFVVSDKLDGCLGILYEYNGVRAIATRGSFDSPQAIIGTKILKKYDGFQFCNNATYLFEIIYPEGNLIVDYGDKEELVLIAVIDNETGKDRDDLYKQWCDVDLPSVKIYDFGCFDDVLKCNRDNAEGFVVKLDNDMRVKVKSHEYLQISRAAQGITKWSILEMAKSGLPDDISKLPVRLQRDIYNTVGQLRAKYRAIDEHAKSVYKEAVKMSREEFADIYRQYKYKAVVFQMLANKPYSEIIWKLIRREM